MKKYFLVPVLAILFFSFSCSQAAKEVKKTEDSKDVFLLKKQEVGLAFDLPAELLPFERAEINAKVDGYVQLVLADIGDRVKKGQVLARLDAPEVAARSAEAGSKYNEARARFLASQDKFNRIQNAAKQQGAIADAEVINTKNRMLADSAALISAESAASAYGQLQEYLIIRAPFDGLITHRFVDQGDFVGNTGNPALFILENPQKLRLRVHVPESYVNSVPSADTLAFTVDASPNITFRAKLARKSGSINRETRTELWEYEFDNKHSELKPGMYTMASLQLNRPAGSFVVPLPAVVTSMEKKFVIRINNGEVEWVEVRDGILQENGMEIFGILNEGDTLLARGSEELKPGTSVKINIKEQ